MTSSPGPYAGSGWPDRRRRLRSRTAAAEPACTQPAAGTRWPQAQAHDAGVGREGPIGNRAPVDNRPRKENDSQENRSLANAQFVDTLQRGSTAPANQRRTVATQKGIADRRLTLGTVELVCRFLRHGPPSPDSQGSVRGFLSAAASMLPRALRNTSY